MSAITDLQAFLAAQNGITALVPAANIWLHLPSDNQSLPYILLDIVEEKSSYQFGGSRITTFRVTITSWSPTLAAANAISAAIETALLTNPLSYSLACYLLLGPKAEAAQGGAYSSQLVYRMLLEYTS